MDDNDFMTSVIEGMTEEELAAFCEALGKSVDGSLGKEEDHE